MEIKRKWIVQIFYGALALSLVGCDSGSTTSKSSSTAAPAETPPTPVKYLYVASGVCYSGSNTTFTATTSSNLVYRIKAEDGSRDITIADYNSYPATSGDSPAGLVEWDDSNLMVLVENTADRKIEYVPKIEDGTRSIFTGNTTILSAVLRHLFKTSDNSVLISKSSIIEKVTSSGVRIGAPFIPTNMGTTCGAANANITSLSLLSNNKIIFTNAAASNNRIGLISATGYAGTSDCLAAQAAPNATAYPTASVYIPSASQLIVAYAGNAITTNLNSIYVYDINETANTISNATKIYDAASYPATYDYLLYGISTMAYDSETSELYISTAVSSATTVVNYAIEKFTYSTSAKTLTRIGSSPFYNYGFDTKCISQMAIATD